MVNYISEVDVLLNKLEIDFPNKPISRVLEEKKYKRIYMLRDFVLNADNIYTEYEKHSEL